MDVFEAMETCRAMRYFKSDPVPPAMIDKILYAATRAPSPGNSQGWDFVVITDSAIKKQLQQAIRTMLINVMGPAEAVDKTTAEMDPVQSRMLKGAYNLTGQLHEVPVIIVVCGRTVYPPHDPQEAFVWSALYPAAQNMLLAARAQGLGSCFTTFQMFCEADIRRIVGIPDDVKIAAFIPIGWPAAKFGPLSRKPVETFVHRERW
jgi:nitroreductase